MGKTRGRDIDHEPFDAEPWMSDIAESHQAFTIDPSYALSVLRSSNRITGIRKGRAQRGKHTETGMDGERQP